MLDTNSVYYLVGHPLLLPCSAVRGSQGNQHWPRWEIGRELLRAAELVGEWGNFSILHGETCHQCVQSSEAGGYHSCPSPILLPQPHDLFPKLCSDKPRGSNICQAKAQATVTGNSSGSVLQLKRGQNQLHGRYCPPHPHTPRSFISTAIGIF